MISIGQTFWLGGPLGQSETPRHSYAPSGAVDSGLNPYTPGACQAVADAGKHCRAYGAVGEEAGDGDSSDSNAAK